MLDTSPLALAQALIRCPSVTPEEGGALASSRRCSATPASRSTGRCSSPKGTPDVENLYARFGARPPSPRLRRPHRRRAAGRCRALAPRPVRAAIVEGGELYGRGAADMKGGVACMIAAALAYLAEHPDFAGSIGFLITGDEEGPAVNGTVKLLDWAKAKRRALRPLHPRRADQSRGAGRHDQDRPARLAHRHVSSCTASRATSPIRSSPTTRSRGMVRLLAALEGRTARRRHRAFRRLEPRVHDARRRQPGHQTSSRARRGPPSTSASTTAGRPTASRRSSRRRLHEAAGNAVRYTASFDPTNAVAFLTAPGPLRASWSQAIEAVTGRRPTLSTTGGTSDARFIKDHCPVVEFGLVGQTMHQVDERVAVADLDRLAAIYRDALERCFSPGCVPETA